MKKLLIAFGLVASLFVGSLVDAPSAVAKAKHPVSNKTDGWVQFAPGSAKLTKAAKSELRAFAKKYKKAKSFKVTGYVQKAGSDANNKKLSTARAKSVRKYLRTIGVKVPVAVKGMKVPKNWGKSASARRAVIKAVMPTSSGNSGGSGNNGGGTGPSVCPNPTFDPTQYWVTHEDNTETASDGDVQMTLKLSPKDQFTTAAMPVVEGCEVSLQWGYIMGDDVFPLSEIAGSYPYEDEITVTGDEQTSVLVDNMSQMSAFSMYGDMCNTPHGLGLQVLVGTEPYAVYPPDCDSPWIDMGLNGIQADDVTVAYDDPWGRDRQFDLDAARYIPFVKAGTPIDVTFNTAAGYQITVANTDNNLSSPPNDAPVYILGSKLAGSHWTDIDSTTLPTAGTDRWYVIDYWLD